MQILFLTADLMFSTRVLGAASAAGIGLKIVPAAAGLAQVLTSDCRLVLIDLTLPSLDVSQVVPLIRAAAPAARILAFGPHVDEQALAAADQAGCDAVLTRGQFNQQYAQILQGVASPGT
jgi:DNA-binding NarL/FixJ family response regulator